MLSIAACSSARPSSATTGRGSGSGGSCRRRRSSCATSTSPRPAFDPAEAAPLGRAMNVSAQRARRQPGDDGLDQAQRLGNLGETDERARPATSPLRSIAHLYRMLVVGLCRVIAAQIPGLRAGSSNQADDAEALGELRRDAAGGEKTVLQSGVFVVDLLEAAYFIGDRLALLDDRQRPVRRSGRRRRRQGPRDRSAGGGRTALR